MRREKSDVFWKTNPTNVVLGKKTKTGKNCLKIET
jgi:hypothetical protein